MKRRTWTATQSGFSLMEIMVALLILAGISAIVAPLVTEQLTKSQVKTAKIQLNTFEQALDAYRLDNGRYPSTEQGLHALVEKPSTPPVPENYDSEGYLKGGELPKDPWNAEYMYESPAPNKYIMRSYGPDGTEGGDGTNADIQVKN